MIWGSWRYPLGRAVRFLELPEVRHRVMAAVAVVGPVAVMVAWRERKLGGEYVTKEEAPG